MPRRALASLASLLVLGCASHDVHVPEPAPAVEVNQGPATYYDDIQPLLQKSCTPCHQRGGIGPFSLDDYASARSHAAETLAAVEARTMPPWLATADGSCGTFLGSWALTEAEIGRFESWLADGLQEGAMRAPATSATPALAAATELSTPEFTPSAALDAASDADEYRCFMLETGVRAASFVTGFEVRPGAPSIVHHVLGMLVDPAALSTSGAGTNQERIEELKAASPEREGWPCFGMAGDGVRVDGFPVVWAPGQPALEFPRHSGVPVTSRQKLVIQVHYSLASHRADGITDQTLVRLHFADRVSRVGGFAIVDPLLESLDSDEPQRLPPREASVEVSWQRSVQELGAGSFPFLELEGVMAHMHQRARRYRFELGALPSATCGLEIEDWDPHWQRLYFYAKPIPVAGDTLLGAVCDFDTTGETEPVSPGWGIANEMCATILYFTAPNLGAL